MSRSKLGVSLFILSEANFFVILIIAYVYYHTIPAGGPSAASSLDPWRTGAFSICLFASSATLLLAERNLRRDRHRAHFCWLVITILLGAIFLVGQGNEYARLITGGVTWSRNLFGTTFFTLTGFHGLHVFGGLCALAIMATVALTAEMTDRRREAFAAVGMYWHFVDAVWVAIFAIVYLWAFV
ncbi:MAG TPA: heme-copper oxidase subunit III [Candidatus Binataceae bacterium]|jgi:heme/copper-type cytochrome/quinol oxidase subunit 3|nr:heme-copper oxidase subunit III [Candidatus Binataceae bacterium]